MSYDFARVLTTGASGMIGSYIDFGMRPDLHELDILDEGAVMRYVEAHRPQAIVHLAGATDMVRCEKEPVYAYELNVRGTHHVARAARAVGATLVYVSTSRVFRGDKEGPYVEADLPDPETHYGLTKYLGELVAARVPDHIIARTAWVFGGGPERDTKFYGSVLKQLGNLEILALNDVYGSPTYGKDFVEAIKGLLEGGKRGTFHITNAEVATRYDIARMIADHVKSKTVVRAVDRSHFASGASLPTNESVSSETIRLRPWKEALAEYITDEWASYLASARISA